jgi:hypothetical protein
LEILEERTLLSTYTVNALTDSGVGSGLTGDLRYCITNATSGNDAITFASGLTGTINVQSALPTLNASVAIQGPGANKVTVSEEGYSYVPFFTVGSSATVQMSGLTLDNAGYYAILNSGSVDASNITFTRAGVNSGWGYAINNQGSATVSNSNFADNDGGIYNNGTLDVSNCSFSGNFGDAIINNESATVSNGTISGCGEVAMTNGGNLTVNSCTLSGNDSGALYNSQNGKLTVNNSTISDNAGGISNEGSATINESTISGNKSIGHAAYGTGGATSGPYGTSARVVIAGDGVGGGIYMVGGTLSINSSTIADNEAIGGSSGGFYSPGLAGNGYGGGLYIDGGTVTIDNSTLAGNLASGGGGYYPGSGYGGGIYNAAGPSALQMYDTILAHNTADTNPDLDGGVTSLGHNLIGNTSGGSGFAASDLVNVNPQLGPLQNNCAQTQTMALLAGSPAIDAGDNTNAPAYDQRGPGFPRIVNGTIDIGAFEVQSSSSTQASSLAVADFPSVITAGSAGSFTVTALNADGTTDTNYAGTVYFSSSDPLAILPANYTFSPNDAGVHTFSATLKTAGTQSITATDTMTGSDTGITVTPNVANQLVFGQQPSTTTAGQTISPAVTVNVEDQYGNPVTSDSSTVTLTLSSGTYAGGSATVSTMASGGVATFTALTINTAGIYTLKATDGSLTPANSGSFTVQSAAASTLSVAGFPTSTTAGVAHNFTVTLRDPYGNLATGYTGTVHFTSSDHKATLPANYSFTAADAGIHTFSATLKTAGTQSITVTGTATASLTGMENGIKVNPAAASQFVLTAPASVSAGVPFNLTFTVEDAYGNVVTGYAGTIHSGSTDSRATLPANYTFTAADAGVHTFTGLVLRKKGYQKISVADTHDSSLTATDTINVV